MWPGGTQPMLLPELSCICIPSFRSVGPRVFLVKYHIWLFIITMETISTTKIACVLSWIKTHHHAKFQRNPPKGSAGMMVQTYKQTYFFIYILAAYTRSCPAKVNMKCWRSLPNFILVCPLIRFWQLKLLPVGVSNFKK